MSEIKYIKKFFTIIVFVIFIPFFSCFQGYDKDDLEWMPQQSKKINTSSQPQSYQTNLSENYDGEDKSNVHKKIEIITDREGLKQSHICTPLG